MAIEAYMTFQTAQGKYLEGESQVNIIKGSESNLGTSTDFQMTDLKNGILFEITDVSFDIEQALNIGSQSSGIGAGRITFNPLSFTRPSDRISPVLFRMCCAGEHFRSVSLFIRRAGGSAGAAAGSITSGQTYLRFDFALVGVKTINWSVDDDNSKEEVTMEYGALMLRYQQQDVTGAGMKLYPASWNRIYNTDKFEVIKAT
ncbi:MAG: type VI secretion system tube protein Hcp [Alphaproteobacteria bacterium]|nr:type VI secretion system tube protein Hcp [Alphaproteobacteria bacterium]